MNFCAKNDERENCQRGKVLTIFQIEIHQFQKMSLLKITKNREKSVPEWKALSHFWNEHLIKIHEKIFFEISQITGFLMNISYNLRRLKNTKSQLPNRHFLIQQNRNFLHIFQKMKCSITGSKSRPLGRLFLDPRNRTHLIGIS